MTSDCLPHQVRQAAFWISLSTGGLGALCIVTLVAAMQELPLAEDASGKPGTAPERHLLRIVSTVWQRPLARRLSLIWCLADGSRAVFSTVGPFALQYTIGLPAPLVPPLILVYILCSAASLPIWLGLARRLGKVLMTSNSLRGPLIASDDL